MLKNYDSFNNGTQQRVADETDQYERFNNYDSSPQRVPENLSYRYPDSEYYQEGAPSAEKPLDLTGEKDKDDVSDVGQDGNKTETCPRQKKVKGRKTSVKKSENEVRTSPRFRKGGKRRTENCLGEEKESWTEKTEVKSESPQPDGSAAAVEPRSEAEMEVKTKPTKEEMDSAQEVPAKIEVEVKEEVEFEEDVEQQIVENGLESEESSKGPSDQDLSAKMETIFAENPSKNATLEQEPQEMEQFSGMHADKTAPIKRKVSSIVCCPKFLNL